MDITAKPVFDSLSLAISAGERVGIVGRSGAGKSTLINLLLRFYDIQSGGISIDGQNIKNVQQESLRENIAVVTQDTSLLHRSVRENILFGRPDATEEEMIDAAKKAEAHDFILELKDIEGRVGYDAHVGERGVSLSGGQRQRIGLARALYKDADVLIFDEATSALDTETETAVMQTIDALSDDFTILIIAHRLSTLRSCDQIVKLENGYISVIGSYKSLIGQSNDLVAIPSN